MTGSTNTRRGPRDGSGAGRSGRAAALPPDERRAAIVTAAIPLLRRGGPDVTTRQIADAAGIAEGTVFRAFPTKQAIIDAVLERIYDSGETIEKVRAIDRAAPLDYRVLQCAEILADRLSTVIDLMIALRLRPAHQADASSRTGGAARAGGRASAQQHGRHDKRNGHRGHPHEKQQGELVEAIAEVLAPDADRLAYPPRRAAHLLRLLTFAGTHRMINDGDALAPNEVADVVLHGIVRSPDHAGLPPPTR